MMGAGALFVYCLTCCRVLRMFASTLTCVRCTSRNDLFQIIERIHSQDSLLSVHL